MAATRIAVLGSTGSIGTQTLDVVRAFPDRLRVVGLAAGSSVDLLARQAREFRPRLVGIARDDQAPALGDKLGDLDIEIISGPDAAARVAEMADAPLVVSAMVGAAGLVPTWKALERGADVALANKETLVAAGGPVTDLAHRTGSRLIPIDSEHSAIFQCLGGRGTADVENLWLTASGGPFLDLSARDMADITPAEAVKHPRWNMGPKISVDSATLMNKGLEVIEARWLFDISVKRIRIVIHPQSTIHSMVEYRDGSFLAQLGAADMRGAIQYAMSCPERWTRVAGVDFNPLTMGPLTFQEPDLDRFPCLRLALEAARIGGTAPAVLNAANEEAVTLFLAGEISFPQIWYIIELVMDAHDPVTSPSLEHILTADAWARVRARGGKGEY